MAARSNLLPIALALAFLTTSVVLAGCIGKPDIAGPLDPVAAVKPLPAPMHFEQEVRAGATPTLVNQTQCVETRPCFDYPFLLPRAAAIIVNASWSDANYAVALEIVSNGSRTAYLPAELGIASVQMGRSLPAGEHILRVHAYRMVDSTYTLDMVFVELAPPARSGCDTSRAVQAGPLGNAVPCVFLPPGATVEPTIGVHPSGAVFYYPVFAADCCDEPRLARSLDRGATWELLVVELQGMDAHSTTLDPYLYVDPATGRVFVDDLAGTCSVLSWSDDLGESWEHSAAGCMEFDHQTLFAGPPRLTSTLGYPNIVYRCAANTVGLNGASTSSTCQRSNDGGRSWLPPGQPAYTPRPGAGHQGVPGYCDGLVGHGTVGPDGTVYLPKGWCGEPWLAISRDEGLTWTRTLVSDKGFLRGDAGYNAHDAGVGVDTEGTVYYGWVAADRMPYLAVSHDGGLTFDEATMVAPEGVNEASHPELVAGGPGKLAFLYLGSTNSPGNFHSFDCLTDPVACATRPAPVGDYGNTSWNAYVTIGVDADLTTARFVTVSMNDPNDPLVRGPCGELRCGSGHDFFDIRLAPDGAAWVALGDSCTDVCSAYNVPGGNQAMVGLIQAVDLRSPTRG